jgi:HAD superfamily hydrolase (TIGR01509 family)
MIDLLRQLKAKRLPLYVFSNTNELAVAHIRHHFPFFGWFDGFILSYEQRCLKPSPGLYEVVEKTSGKSGLAILYIDDRLENIETGIHRGWQTILHQAPEETRARVGELGLLG